MNFSILNDGVTVTATTTSQVLDLGAIASFYEDVAIYNPGPNTVYLKAGNNSNVLAGDQSMPILPQTKEIYRKASFRYLAYKSNTGTQTITVFVGEGA